MDLSFYKRRFRYSVIDVAFNAGYANFTTPYLQAYAVRLGASAAQLGSIYFYQNLISAIPSLIAARFSVNRRIRGKLLLSLGLTNKVMWLPLVLTAFFAFTVDETVAIVILALSISNVCGVMANTIWTKVMADFVPVERRGKDFGYRNMIGGIAGFGTLVVTLVLAMLIAPSRLYLIFFGLGVVLGLISWFFLAKMGDPSTIIQPDESVGIKPPTLSDLISIFRIPAVRFFLLAWGVFQLFFNLPGAVWNLYLIKYIGGDEIWIAVAALTAVITQSIFSYIWGRFNNSFGAKPILVICSLGASFVPIMFLSSTTLPLQVVLSVLIGIVLSGIALSSFSYAITIGPPELRPLTIAAFNMINALTIAVGSLLGAFMVEAINIQSVFMIAAIGRLISVPILVKFVPEIFQPTSDMKNYLQTHIVRPLEAHAWAQPILAVHMFEDKPCEGKAYLQKSKELKY